MTKRRPLPMVTSLRERSALLTTGAPDGVAYRFPALAATPEALSLLRANAPVAMGLSGGKDSTVMAVATTAFLDEIGHSGPRLLIHSDLGRVEWRASLPMCRRLADRLGLELVVVNRQAGDLMDRWLTRWANNKQRYASLACVKLILPWSTPSMRFCTSELKTSICGRYLVERFPGATIVSVSGIRGQESPSRAKSPIFAPQSKLANETFATSGYDWHPLHSWTLDDVLAYHRVYGLPLHEAYTTWGTSRVSCAFCILGSRSDLVASATCAENHAIYREMVGLEIASTFRFQDGTWLGDVAAHLLDDAARSGLADAKRRAAVREAAEARIPPRLLYRDGWPTVLPTRGEAELLGEIRQIVAEAVQLSIGFTEPDAIIARFAELMEQKAFKEQVKQKALARKRQRASAVQPGLSGLAAEVLE